MGQYEVAKILFEADAPLTRREIANKIGNIQPSTVGDTLRVLKRKEYAKDVEEGYVFHPSATEDDLERMRPMTVKELREKRNNDDE